MDPIPLKKSSEDVLRFVADSLDEIETIESLPHRQAFEQVLYDNRLYRQIGYTANQPIPISPQLLGSAFPNQLRDLFITDAPAFTFDDLTAAQLTDGDGNSELAMRFRVNDRGFTAVTDGPTALFATTNLDGSPVKHSFDRQSAVALIAALFYAKLYSINPKYKMDLYDDPLLIERDPDTMLVEQILLSLGNLDGQTTIETAAILPTDDGFIGTVLRQTEKPHLSGINHELRLTSGSLATATSLHQRSVSVISPDTPRLDNQFANIVVDSPFKVEHTINPREDPEEWTSLCLELYALIEPEIRRYESL